MSGPKRYRAIIRFEAGDWDHFRRVIAALTLAWRTARARGHDARLRIEPDDDEDELAPEDVDPLRSPRR